MFSLITGCNQIIDGSNTSGDAHGGDFTMLLADVKKDGAFHLKKIND